LAVHTENPADGPTSQAGSPTIENPPLTGTLTLVPPITETEVEQRRLADYDSALKVAGFEGGMTW
jgi:hypothetical protein